MSISTFEADTLFGSIVITGDHTVHRPFQVECFVPRCGDPETTNYIYTNHIVAFLAGAGVSEADIVRFIDWADLFDHHFRDVFGRDPFRI